MLQYFVLPEETTGLFWECCVQKNAVQTKEVDSVFNRVKLGAFALVLGAACMISSVAAAQISNDRIAIGGVGPGCTPDYVESVYGAPTSQESGSNGDQTYLEYNYNNGYIIGFDGAGSQAVAVTCTTDNLATPDGVTVGMEASVLSDKYGTADHIYNFNDKSLYVYDGTDGEQLAFDVQNFFIVSISARVN